MINLTITLRKGGSKSSWNFGIICSKKDMYKLNLAAFQVLPFCTYTLAPVVLLLLEAPLKSSFMAVRPAVIFCWISCTDTKWWLLRPSWVSGRVRSCIAKDLENTVAERWLEFGFSPIIAALQRRRGKVQDPTVSPFSHQQHPSNTSELQYQSRIHCLSYRDKLVVHHTQVGGGGNNFLLIFCDLWLLLLWWHYGVPIEGLLLCLRIKARTKICPLSLIGGLLLSLII